MKKLKFLIMLLALSLTGFAQNSEDSTGDNSISSYTEPIENTVLDFPLTTTNISTETRNYLDSKLTSYNVYGFHFSDLRAWLDSNMYALDFNLGSTFLSLQRRDIRSPDYTQTETLEDGSTVTRFQQDLENDSTYEVHFLMGFADRDKNQIVRLSVEENGLTGYIWNTETNHVLYYTSLQDFIKSNNNDFTTSDNYLLVFDLGALRVSENAICGALEAGQQDTVAEKGYFEQCTPRFLEIAAEGDKKWCDIYGGNASGKILETLFFVEGIYTYNFNVSFVVNNINLLTNNGSLYNSNSSQTVLGDFKNNWNSNHAGVKRDITLLFSGNPTFDLATVLGRSYVNTLCDNYWAYGIMSNGQKKVLTTAHEIGHIFGSLHDDEHYGTSTCSGNDVPIMCAQAVANGPFFYFSSYTRNIILTSINNHAYCLNDYANGNPVTKFLKSWSNFQNQRWVATWLLQNQDKKVVGNFDGENDDEEIFFAAPDNKWVGIMDFSCDQGTNWYHLWGNSGNGTFGTWVRNSGDKYLAGDFDGNGKADLFSVSGSAYWAALQEYNPSNWSWIHKWGNTGNRWIAGWYINTNDTYVIGDFDGDGKDELFCVNPNGWAALIKFNWVTVGSGGYYNPQVIWSNNGSHSFEGQQISSIQRWYKGRMKTTAKDEIFTIGNSFTGVVRYNGSGWTFITGEGITTSFTTPNTTPANAGFRFMGTGNIDADNYDEYIAISQQWIGTQDYSGGGAGMNHNWNNGGNSMLNDWNLNTDVEYLLVKAAPNANKQIFGIKSEKKSSGWGPWYKDWWEPTLVGMYKGNTAFQNFRMAPQNSGTADNHSLRIYPNPTDGVLNIALEDAEENVAVTITDMTGKLISQYTFSQQINTISLKELPAGLYILHAVFADHTSLTTKVSVYGK